MKKVLTYLAVFLCTGLYAQYVNISLTGFNVDGIAEGTGTNSLAVTSWYLDASNHIMYDKAFGGANGLPAGLPNSGTIAASNGITYQLVPYTGNNVLMLGPQAPGAVTTGKLVLTTPASYVSLSLLTFATEGQYVTPTYAVTLSFTDGTKVSGGTYSVFDWFTGSGNVYFGFGRTERLSAGPYTDDAGPYYEPYMYACYIKIPCADQDKMLDTITITNNGFKPNLVVMAAAGIPYAPTLVSATSVNEKCFGEKMGSINVIPTGNYPPYKYAWSPSGGTNATASNLSAGTYICTVTDSLGCTHLDTAVITQPTALKTSVTTNPAKCNGSNTGNAVVSASGGTGSYTYNWAPISGTADSITGLSAGSYTCMVTDSNGCKSTDTAVINQPTPLLVTASGAKTICIGQSATISANATGGTPGYTYAWNTGSSASSITVSPVVTTTYTVTAGDTNGCASDTATVTIAVRPPLGLSTSPSKAVSICAGDTVAISATATGGDGNYTYTWTPGSIKGTGITVTPAATTTYTVIVNDGCSTPNDTAAITVFVNPLPVVNFGTDIVSGCYPLCVNFIDSSTVKTGNITSWAWNFGDTNSSTSQNPFNCYTQPGSYSVSLTATTDSGCTSSKTISNLITVYNHPHAAFNVSLERTTDSPVFFTDESTDDYGITVWAWAFGSGPDSVFSTKNAVYTYQDTGNYCATLNVTNMYGCTDSATQCFEITPEFTLYIPDAFSPNGDGKNDVFAPKGMSLTDFDMYIFDRWGTLIYHTNDINKGWNGTVNNKGSDVCQQDTYVYMITCEDIRNKPHSYIGKVTLVK